jgi:hypothetical protein
MLSAMVTALIAITASASAIASLAFACARRRSLLLFVVSVVVLWLVVGGLFGHYSAVSSLVPNRIPEWRHILASLVVIAPFALVPAAFTLPSVFRGAPIRRIVVLASLGAIVALPLAIMAVVPSACYVAHDCP